MTTALVLGAGGSLGAVQVGMLQALAARGVEPDLVVGTSAGAVNAVWVAGHGMSSSSLDELAGLWRGLHRHDVFPVSVRGALRGLAGRRPSLFSSERLAGMIREHAGFAGLRDAAIPVHLVATSLLDGDDVVVSEGDVAEAVCASAAIPGIFPPVLLGGRWLVDGAVAARTGVRHAIDLGADEVWVLPAGVPCALERPPRSPVGVALHALALLTERRLIADVRDHSHRATIRLLPPLCPLAVSAGDFTQATELIRRGRESSERWLAAGGADLAHPERFLVLHDHGPRRSGAA